ncbi:hypothetical protein CHX23_00700 [Rhodococcoides fascians]|nr:hypothetical protein CHX23_00700 [Rhodococcus fascians]
MGECKSAADESNGEIGRMMNRTLYSMMWMMAIIAFVALLWGTVGYVYADTHPLQRAAFVGGGVLIAGWLILFAAVGIKISRLKARRRQSNSDEQ